MRMPKVGSPYAAVWTGVNDPREVNAVRSLAVPGLRGLGDDTPATAVQVGDRVLDVTYIANLILAGRGAEVPATLAYAMLPDIARGSGLTLPPDIAAQKAKVLAGDYVGAYGQDWQPTLDAVMNGARQIVVHQQSIAKPDYGPTGGGTGGTGTAGSGSGAGSGAGSGGTGSGGGGAQTDAPGMPVGVMLAIGGAAVLLAFALGSK